MVSISYCYATAGQVWTIRCDQMDPEIGSAPALQETFRTIALSFRVRQPETLADPRG
jgi:hypothetical protein